LPERTEINGEELPSFRVVGLQAEVYHGSPEDAAEMKSNRLRGSVSVVTVLLTAVVTVTLIADTDIPTCGRTAATCLLSADTVVLNSIIFVLAVATCLLTAYTDLLTYITDMFNKF